MTIGATYFAEMLMGQILEFFVNLCFNRFQSFFGLFGSFLVVFEWKYGHKGASTGGFPDDATPTI